MVSGTSPSIVSPSIISTGMLALLCMPQDQAFGPSSSGWPPPPPTSISTSTPRAPPAPMVWNEQT